MVIYKWWKKKVIDLSENYKQRIIVWHCGKICGGLSATRTIKKKKNPVAVKREPKLTQKRLVSAIFWTASKYTLDPSRLYVSQ